jgi:hypothetical protein
MLVQTYASTASYILLLTNHLAQACPQKHQKPKLRFCFRQYPCSTCQTRLAALDHLTVLSKFFSPRNFCADKCCPNTHFTKRSAIFWHGMIGIWSCLTRNSACWAYHQPNTLIRRGYSQMWYSWKTAECPCVNTSDAIFVEVSAHPYYVRLWKH